MLALRPCASLPARRGAPPAALTRHVAVCAASPATSRRRLAGGAAVLVLLGDGGSAAAFLPFAPGATRYTDEDGGFALLVPAGWTQLQLSPAAREVAGVFASFRDPAEASNTLGGRSARLGLRLTARTDSSALVALPTVFITDAPPGCRSMRDTGTVAEYAARLAGSAPGQSTELARERTDASGQLFYEVDTFVGGGTAGRFGSAIETLAQTVTRGKFLQVRGTASAASWRRARTKAALRAALASFTLLQR